MLAGGSTAVTNSPACVDPSIGICSESPSVVPSSVAEVAPEPQVIAKVTAVPGVATDGVTSITGGGAGITVSDAVRIVPSLHPIGGVYVPGVMLLGKLTVTMNSPDCDVG